jgi:hypothetical protein
MVQFTARLEKVDSDLWQFLFRVEKDTAEQFIEGDNRRVVCTINGTVQISFCLVARWPWWLSNPFKPRTQKPSWIRQGDTFTVILEKDTSEYGMPMSEEFREVLDQKPDADRIFHTLTPGKQRTLMHLSDNVKNPDIRIRRALVVTDHLIHQNGIIDFKGLNEELKAANKAANRN